MGAAPRGRSASHILYIYVCMDVWMDIWIYMNGGYADAWPEYRLKLASEREESFPPPGEDGGEGREPGNGDDFSSDSDDTFDK